MTSAEFNARVREAARHQRLPGYHRPGGGTLRHKWKVTVERASEEKSREMDFGINPLTGQRYFSAWVFNEPGKSAVNRLYQVFVGTGCVNDEPAAIEYLAKGDPRGWEMPSNYPPYAAVSAAFGAGYAFVDRPLWEDPAPFLFLTAPDASASDLGGFVRTPDQRRPGYFRTKEAWERELYQASVVVSLSPFRSDPAAVNLRLGGARARRWRVTAGKLPTAVADAGVAKIASRELARIYLLRTPGKPEEDEVFVHQRGPNATTSYGECWNLAARSIMDLPLLALIGITAEVLAIADLGLLAMGLTGVTVGAVLVGIEEGVVLLLLDNLEAIVAATSGVAFWSV